MKDPRLEAERWIMQAENDLEFARSGLREGFYAQVCFLCQQIGEKAMKAIHYRKGERFVIGHSIYKLLRSLNISVPEEASLLEIAGILRI